MSSDLFAAFGDPAPATVQKQAEHIINQQDPWRSDGEQGGIWQTDGKIGTRAEDAKTAAEDNEDDDDFGDFEDASAPSAPIVAAKTPVAVPQSQPPPATRHFSQRPETSRPGPSAKSASPAKSAPAQKKPLPFSPKPQAQAEASRIGRHPFADHMDFLFSGGDDEYDAGEDELDDLATNPEAAMAYSKRIIAEQMAKENMGSDFRAPNDKPTKPLPFKPKSETVASKPSLPQHESARSPNKLQKKSGYAPAKDPNVLFDADNISSQDENEDDDDFGDFEAGTAENTQPRAPSTANPSPSKPQMPRIDLLGLNDPFANDAGLDGMTSPRQRRAASLLGAPVDSRPSKLVISVTPSTVEDAWEDFEAAEPTLPVQSITDIPDHVAPLPTQLQSKPLPTTPPTTIPPPSTLLSLLPTLLSSLQTTLLSPLSHMTDQPSRSALLAHPSTQLFLRTHLSHLLAFAHILAGRKLRWKRDNILAQSTRVGAAGGKGMKLAGVDKSILVREEREALDAVRAYRPLAGKLRAAVASMAKENSTSTSTTAAAGLVVPDISETMPIRMLSVNEGGLTGVRPCALCGLKREERVAKLHDGGVVEDSFGEWWVEGAEMHLVCCRFWVEWAEGRLRGR